MAKDPAFLFYSQDFITGTMFFTDEQVGKYTRLLCAQHQHGHLTIEQVNYICRTNEPTILKKFVQDQDGLFFNERLEEEMKKRKSFCDSRKENIKKRYNKKCNTTYVATNVEHMENENENENVNKKERVIGEEKLSKKFDFTIYPQFEEVLKKWIDYKKSRKESYKNQQSIDALAKRLYNLSGGDKIIAEEIINQSMANNWAGIFQLNDNKRSNNAKPTNDFRVSVGVQNFAETE